MISPRSYQSANPVRHPLRHELAILAVIVVLLTYWTVMLVAGMDNVKDRAGIVDVVDVRGVQITTPSTTPAVTYQPVPADE